MDIRSWLRQPTTINGLGLAIGTVAGVVAHALSGETSWSVAAGSIVAAIVHIVLPDNTSAAAALGKLTQDSVAATLAGRLSGAAPLVAADAAAAMDALAAARTPQALAPEARP